MSGSLSLYVASPLVVYEPVELVSSAAVVEREPWANADRRPRDANAVARLTAKG